MCRAMWFASICTLLLVQLVSSDEISCDTAIKDTVLEPLKGKTYSATDEVQGYSYIVGICADLIDQLEKKDEEHHTGAIQIINNGESTTKSLGQVTNTDLMRGTNWMKLEYRDGHKYTTHCGNSGRRTVVFIICDESDTQGKLKFIEENKNKTAECYYLFELSVSAVCADLQPKSLGPGSIVTIVFFVFVGAYLVIGFLYQRFVVRAVGKEQIPNYAFWQDIGNLSADGCNFVFRSNGGGSSGSREYRGIGDSQLRNTPDDPPSDTDEHLLPM